MPTIIDTLIVKLGLDPTPLTAKGKTAGKQLDSLESSVKKVNKESKEAAKGFAELGRSLGSLLAVIGGTYAIKAFVSDFISANAALDRFSKNVGLNVSTVSAWGNAVEEFGGNAKNLQGTLAMLSKEQTQLRLTGESSLIPYFARLGVDIGAFGQKVRPVDQILLDLSERFSHMDRTQANNLGHLIGIDQDTLNLLLQGRQAVELMIKRQKEHNAVTKEEAEQASKWQRSVVQLNQTFNKFGRDLLMSAAPALEKLIGWLTEFGNWVHQNQQFIGDFLKVMAVGLAAIAVITSPITATTAAIVALAAGIALLWQDYQTWQNGGKSFIDWQVWKDRVDAVKEALHKLREEFDYFTTIKIPLLDKLLGLGGADPSKPKGSSGKSLLDLIPGMSALDKALDFSGEQHSGARGGPSKSAQGIGHIEGFYAKGAKPNRPQRNHNPGDIEYGPFAKAHGATGSDGRFAIFPDDAAGYRALDALLKSPAYSGLTVAKAIEKFAPSKENDTAKYIRDFTARTGLQAGDNINGPSPLDGIKGASSTVAQASPAGTTQTSNDHSRSVSIGKVEVQTQATDAKGIASDLGQSLNYLFASQANGGLT